MAKRGGKREGSGRKKGIATIEREKAKDYIAQRIAEYMPAIFDALITKGLQGDTGALRELLDRAFGRPNQAMDVTTKGESMIDEQRIKEAAKKLNEIKALHI